jgi:lipoprotein-anchoring transpeptidase ErfK/SrfK
MLPEQASRAPISAEWLRRGLQALRAGQRADARRAFQAALAADPHEARAWLHLARLSAPRARLAYLARAVELGDQHARAELRRARRQSLAAPVAGPAPAVPVVPVWRRPDRAWRWDGSRARSAGLALALVALALTGLVLRLAPQRPAPGWASDLTAALFARVAQISPPAIAAGGGVNASGARSMAVTPSATPTRTPTATYTASPTASPSASPTPSPTTTPTAVPPTAAPAIPAERWIEVDLGDQSVLAREGEAAVNTFLVSTGTWQFPTVLGEYRIYVKYVAADMAGPGYYLPAVPYVMYFHEGYGLHGTYWHNNFGTPMSHGCVNLRTEDAAWLFAWATVGTRVVVHD